MNEGRREGLGWTQKRERKGNGFRIYIGGGGECQGGKLERGRHGAPKPALTFYVDVDRYWRSNSFCFLGQ